MYGKTKLYQTYIVCKFYGNFMPLLLVICLYSGSLNLACPVKSQLRVKCYMESSKLYMSRFINRNHSNVQYDQNLIAIIQRKHHKFKHNIIKY